MNIYFGILITVATFWFMEFMAWFTHKYVMHGFLWYFHKDHHQKEPGFFEKNDFFFTIFAVPSWLFTMFGMMNGNDWRLYVGVGILCYGICYFLVHDVFIHQRFKWFRGAKHPYFKAIRQAHNVHHKYKDKEDGECFGMLVIPFNFLKQAYKKRKQSATA